MIDHQIKNNQPNKPDKKDTQKCDISSVLPKENTSLQV